MTSDASERPAAAASAGPGPSAGERVTSRERLPLVLVLGFLTASGPLTVALYLPAITGELMTTAAAVQLTLTGMLAGLALGQLLVGPVADAVGRRAPVLAGVALHVVVSALCVVAPNIAVLGVRVCCRAWAAPRRRSWPWRSCMTCSSATPPRGCCPRRCR